MKTESTASELEQLARVCANEIWCNKTASTPTSHAKIIHEYFTKVQELTRKEGER